MHKQQIDYKVLSAHLITIVIWASAFPGIRAGLEHYTPGHLSLFRLLIGSVLLLLFALVTRMKLPDLRDVPVILLLGFLGFTVYHVGLNMGEKTVAAGPASLIVSMTPVFSILLAAAFMKERLRLIAWVGTLISFFGVSLISFEKGGVLSFNMGVLFILIASLAESIYFVFQNRYLEKYGFLSFTTYTILAGTIPMLFFLPGLYEAVITSTTEATLSVIYLGIFPTVIPYFTLAYVVSKVGSSEATSALFLTPVLSFIIAWIWLGEVPTLLSLIGGAISLIGVILVNVKFAKEKEDIPVEQIRQSRSMD
ncbi:EamA family transporter [Hazenella sp. IB182357]|uniref:EamA family transporter n=1 Tax=Polycladospora coralii TaxID=2771432 RepID=A0A926RUL2_9BACL|nr:EamA family transporter [Polycladospora coralii]MBD1373108.1 EamA family transporter [Polycladospora coralii]MBS7531666.1 EamA family transporter [Polycladospora coralii]